jgi:hypothetical protein
MTDESDNNEWGIDRRTVLKGAAVGAGIAAMPGLASAKGHGGGGKPCFKDFECREGATYVKIEFVEYYEEEEEYVCEFVEETDTGLVSIDSYTSKDGDCEPTSVDWSVADGYVATKVMAYGGTDCTKVEDLDSTGGTFEPELVNSGGNTAAISNLQFCLLEEIELGGTTSLAYEDLPLGGGNDYDYNDWVSVVDTSAVGLSTDDGFRAESLELVFTPRARGAAYDHRFGVNFPDGEFCNGTYDISYSADGADDDELSGEQFTPGEDVVIFERTSNVLSNLSNTGRSPCEAPAYTATLTIEFDERCTLNVGGFDAGDAPHGSDLSYSPFIEVYDTGGSRIEPDDVRILTVPSDWQWPAESNPIWDVYGDAGSGSVREENGEPVFDDNWFENDPDESQLADCDPEEQ